MTVASIFLETRSHLAKARPGRNVLRRERPDGAGPWLVSIVARLVLALLIGASFHSVQHFLPHSGEQAGPLLGI